MLKTLGISALALASLVPGGEALAVTTTHRHYSTYHHGRHPVRKTIKRVGIGAAGGAAVGALVGGGPGAAIGAVAGGGAGAIYDHHEKRKGN